MSPSGEDKQNVLKLASQEGIFFKIVSNILGSRLIMSEQGSIYAQLYVMKIGFVNSAVLGVYP